MKLVAKALFTLCISFMLLWGKVVWAVGVDITWSTFMGGASSDGGTGIAVDQAGNVYVTGETNSSGFPTTLGGYDRDYNGDDDVFVAKFTASGTDLVYATFVGGISDDKSHGIAVDSSGKAHIIGETWSTDFPTTPGAFDTSYNGSWRDVFVVRLDPTGGSLDYATYLGGLDVELGYGVALDDFGRAHVTGYTYSSDFPTTDGVYQTDHPSPGYPSVFVTRLDLTGGALDYSTFLGGSHDDYSHGIVVDGEGCAYVIGETWSPDFPTTPETYDPSYGGDGDVFFARLNAAGDSLLYATFLGGSSDEYGYAVALDSLGKAYLTGETWSDDFPTTSGALDVIYDNVDAFVTKLNLVTSTLDYSTFLGGRYDEYGYGIAVDDSGGAHIVGETWSDDFPVTVEAYDTTFNGDNDVFVAELNPAGSSLHYATYLGGISNDLGHAITLDRSGNPHVSGRTSSSGFPTTFHAFDEIYNGGQDVFVAKLRIGAKINPPEVVENLRVTLAGGHLALTWSPVTADTSGNPISVEFYNIYRDTVPFFEPGSDPFDGVVGQVYIDLSGVGNTAANCYYAVTAVYGSKESEYCGVVGEFDTKLKRVKE